jgi:UDP-N-acetylglucosamine 2-epimerase (non-hydrolysing)
MQNHKKSLKIMSIAGARPNFMKIAPLTDAIAAHNSSARSVIEHILVHTGQHYDQKMSDLFFKELGIPEPDINLGVGGGSHAVQTAEIMKRIEPVLIEHRPDFLLVVGDVNSTIACALVAVKLGIRIIHVEAGLRSFDRGMPEEINRILTDAISDILFTTERGATDNLVREGIDPAKIHFVGNVMIDTLLAHRAKAEQSDILERLQVVGDYGIVTLHRPANVDDPGQLAMLLVALNEVCADLPLIFPVHPRTRSRLAEHAIPVAEGIRLVEPLGYLDFLKLQSSARLVLTDSGGIQEETTVLGVPCLTLRESTERPVTVTDGTNRLVPLERTAIITAARDILHGGVVTGRIPELWDGGAARRIVAILAEYAGRGV